MIITSSVISVVVAILGLHLNSRAASDIGRISQGEFLEVESVELYEDSSLLFRIAHFFERYMETTETTVGTLWGLGFMAEDSQYTENHFNFIIGLSDVQNEKTVQIDTSDIAWSIFIVRYGILGTFIYLLLYSYIILYYWRIKTNFSVSVVLSLFLIIGISFTSDQLYYTTVLVFPLLYYDYYEN